MQSLMKTFTLSLIVAGLTACGGSGGGGGDKSPALSSTSSSVTPSSSSPASSSAPASSSISSSSTPSSAAAGSENTLTATGYISYSIAEIENCGVNISKAEKTFPIFADYDGGVQNQSLSSINITGWNHATNGSTTEWVNLKNSGTTYNFSSNAKVNSSCNSADTLDMVLVKKIADWDHQHANGFERNILAHGYKFGDIENLIVDLKVNSAKTSVPSVESLKTIYSSYVDNVSDIESLDEGKVNVDITLHDGANLYGKINLQLDQATQADKWVRVTIPMNKVYFYQQINYDPRTTKTQAEMSNVVIQRILVVGETKKGDVLRGSIEKAKKWSTSVPETFKEMDLSFKKIEFQLK